MSVRWHLSYRPLSVRWGNIKDNLTDPKGLILLRCTNFGNIEVAKTENVFFPFFFFLYKVYKLYIKKENKKN